MVYREAVVSYHVFVVDPVTGEELGVFCDERAYDASALANALDGAGYAVQADLWGATVWDAMVSPAVWERHGLGAWVELLG